MAYRIVNFSERQDIHIQMIEKKQDGNIPFDCLFCEGLALRIIKDARPDHPIFEIRSCKNPACLVKAYSYVLQASYGFSADESTLPESVFADLP